MVEFYYYRDRDGKERGPFSNGQLTNLLNRGVLSNRSQLRPEAEQELYLYYYRPIDRSLLSETPTGEDERKMRRGRRVSHALELHVARREIEKEEGATSQSSPLDFDRDFAANELALVYAGFEIHPIKPRSLLRLNYHGTGGTEATILLSEDLEFYDWFANEQDVFEVFARAVRAHAAEAEAEAKRFANAGNRDGWRPRKKSAPAFSRPQFALLPLDAQIAFTDRFIDGVVYRQYGLTQDERRIVEANNKPSH